MIIIVVIIIPILVVRWQAAKHYNFLIDKHRAFVDLDHQVVRLEQTIKADGQWLEQAKQAIHNLSSKLNASSDDAKPPTV